MYHSDYFKALELACIIHGRYQEQIDTKIEDKKLAIYYIQGGCLTQAFVAMKGWAYGDLINILRVKRFIDESNNLILGLTVIENSDRYLKRFFTNQIIDIPLEKLEPEIRKKKLWTKELFDEWINVGKDIKNEASKGVHPNLESLAYNSNVDTGKYDYKLESPDFHFMVIDNFDFANFIIIPAIDSVLYSNDIFTIDKSLLDKLQEARQHIQEIANSNKQK